MMYLKRENIRMLIVNTLQKKNETKKDFVQFKTVFSFSSYILLKLFISIKHTSLIVLLYIPQHTWTLVNIHC